MLGPVHFTLFLLLMCYSDGCRCQLHSKKDVGLIARQGSFSVYVLQVCTCSLSAPLRVQKHARDKFPTLSSPLVWMIGYLSLWPCDEMATCLRCGPALTPRQLGQTSASIMTLIAVWWIDGWMHGWIEIVDFIIWLSNILHQIICRVANVPSRRRPSLILLSISVPLILLYLLLFLSLLLLPPR